MGSTTTWVVGLPPKRSLAQLLGDQVELGGSCQQQALEQLDDGALGGGVDRGRLVAAHRLRLPARARPGRAGADQLADLGDHVDETNPGFRAGNHGSGRWIGAPAGAGKK